MKKFQGAKKCKLFSDTTEKDGRFGILGEKIKKRQIMMMSKFFILIFATCIQLHEKITTHKLLQEESL